MIYNRQKKELAALTLDADGNTDPLNVEAYKTITLSIGSDAAADLTLKVKGTTESQQTTDVDFTASQGLDNRWDYILCKDREDDAGLDGDTGIVISGGADARQLEVNANALDFICLEVSGYSAGSIKVVVSGYSNA